MEEKTTETVKKGNVKALLPIGVFLVLYLGLGILFEYGMGIPMGFYQHPRRGDFPRRASGGVLPKPKAALR